MDKSRYENGWIISGGEILECVKALNEAGSMLMEHYPKHDRAQVSLWFKLSETLQKRLLTPTEPRPLTTVELVSVGVLLNSELARLISQFGDFITTKRDDLIRLDEIFEAFIMRNDAELSITKTDEVLFSALKKLVAQLQELDK